MDLLSEVDHDLVALILTNHVAVDARRDGEPDDAKRPCEVGKIDEIH